MFFPTGTHDQARFDFNVVPAQALMELFLAEEGAQHTQQPREAKMEGREETPKDVNRYTFG